MHPYNTLPQGRALSGAEERELLYQLWERKRQLWEALRRWCPELRHHLKKAEPGAMARDVHRFVNAERKEIPAVRAAEGLYREAREKLLMANLGLVIDLARRFHGGLLDLEDRIAEGIAGLLRGIDEFDPDYPNKLNSYAGWKIRQALQQAAGKGNRGLSLGPHHYTQMKQCHEGRGGISA